MNMYWVYHKEHEAKVVEETEYFPLLEAGWHDNPAKCKKEVPVPETGISAALPGSPAILESGAGTVDKAIGKAKPSKDEDWPRQEKKVKNDVSSATNTDSVLSS